MSKNAELMSTAPSFYVVTRAPRSVRHHRRQIFEGTLCCSPLAS